MVNITRTIGALSIGIQHNLVAGMSVNIFNTYLRFFVSVINSQSIAKTQFSPSQSDIENYLGLSKPVIQVGTKDTSNKNVFQIAIIQFNSNPHAYDTNSASIGIKIVSSTGATFNRTIQLINLEPIYYNYLDTPKSGKAYCNKTKAAIPYNMTVYCPFNRTYSLLCPGSRAKVHSYICPNSTFTPICTKWNGDSYVKDPLCTPVTYTSDNTTCVCLTKSSSRRLQMSSSEDFDEVSTDTNQVATHFVDTITSITEINQESIEKNSVIFATMLTFTILLFFGLFAFVAVDIKEAKNAAKFSREENINAHKFEYTIKLATPVEFRPSRWIYRLWDKMLVEHDLISCFAKYNSQGDYRAAKWLALFVYIFNNLFVDTILSVLFFVDTGVCKTYTTSSQCTHQLSLDQLHSLCSWNPSQTPSCSFNESVGKDVVSSLVLSVILALALIPLNIVMYFMVREFRNFVCSIFLKETRIKHLFGALDMDGLQTEATTILRYTI